MSQPDIVSSTLDGEPVAARVGLGGEDELFVTPTRTLVYRADGLLSDESVEEFPHDAERVDVSQRRRKSKITLNYGLDGERTIALSSARLDEALHPVLAGVLNAAGITDAGETVTETFRFSELTLVVTSARVVKHIGSSVWDDEFEEFHFDDVTDLAFEEGSVATSVVITTGDRQERFKAPNDEARRVREALETALLEYYDAESLEAFRTAVAPESEGDAGEAAGVDADGVAFGDGPDPLSANPAELDDAPMNGTRDPSERTPSDAEEEEEEATEVEAEKPDPPSDAPERVEASQPSGGAQDAAALQRDPSDAEADPAGGFEGSGFESAATVDEEDVAAELADLRAAVEAQNERLQRQQDLIEQLVEELRRGR